VTARRHALCLLLALIVLALGAKRATAQALVADLTRHLVAITTGFTGTEVVLFGAIDGPGQVAIVVEGPLSNIVVRRKDSFAGVWINNDSVEFEDVPGYYAVSASAPMAELLSPRALGRHQIGLDNLRIAASAAEGQPPLTEEQAALFKSAVLRLKQSQGLYPLEPGTVRFLGNRLFRTSLDFPANVPTGIYQVHVYLIRDGDVVSAETTPLTVSKVGVGAEIFEFARFHAYIYATLSVVGAIAVGWLAAAMFRRS
jgi:uncharacterized protein (TIGR02186 family)